MISADDLREPLMGVRKTGLLASFLFVISVLAACEPNPRQLAFSGAALGTSYHIKVVEAGSPAMDAGLAELVGKLLDDLDHKLSTYKPDSELNRFNRHPVGQPFAASDDFYQVLEVADRIYRLSGGAFDPTVRPLVDLWGFGPVDTGDRVPAESEITALLGEIGFDRIELAAANQVIRRAPVTLDLSAVAKGFIVDRLAAELRAQGVDDYMVEVGGEIRAGGRRADGGLWRIAVEVPAAGGGVERVLELSDIGVATSGDYRNYFERDGERYSHTIDPRSGRPIRHRLASVTVLAPTAAEADALATALMVMGPEHGADFAAANELAALFLVKQGDGFAELGSAAMGAYLR
jgi:thiamine biosynthesis lipoprotein